MPEYNPTIFKLKLADWRRSSEAIQPRLADLTPAERLAAQFLLTAWREYAYSEALARHAGEQIDEMAAADVAHASDLGLKTIAMSFRGIARVVYCTDKSVYDQFQQRLCADAGIAVPTAAFALSAADMPAAASLVISLYQNYRIAERDVTSLEADASGTLRANMVLNNLVKDRTYQFTFELLGRSGAVVRSNTFSFTAPRTSSTWMPDIFNCSAIPAGTYTLRIRIGDYILASRSLSKAGRVAPVPSPSPSMSPSPEPLDVTVSTIEVYASTATGAEAERPREIFTNTQYITPKISVNCNSTESHTQTFTVSIISPAGVVLSTPGVSPAGATFSTNRTFSGRQTTLRLRSWGSESGRMYAVPGKWTIRVRTQDGREFSSSFTVKHPAAPVKPFNITGGSFHTPKHNDSSTVEPNADWIQPTIKMGEHINGIYEVRYSIHTLDGTTVAAVPTTNLRINGTSAQLPPASVTVPLPAGRYFIDFTINGFSYPMQSFEVAKTGWGCVGYFIAAAVIYFLGSLLATI